MSGKIVVKLDIAQILKVFIVNYTQWKPQVNHGSKLLNLSLCWTKTSFSKAPVVVKMFIALRSDQTH